MNMFKPVKAKTSTEYLDSLPPERRVVVEFLDKFIQEVAPSLKPHFAYNMLGYGSFKYKNYKGEVIDWPTISLANQKNYISLYICSVQSGEYIAEKHKEKLGKVSVGKSCIRFKRIEDLNLKELKNVIKIAEQNPGLTGVGASAKNTQ
jgi:hypothetical protein